MMGCLPRISFSWELANYTEEKTRKTKPNFRARHEWEKRYGFEQKVEKEDVTVAAAAAGRLLNGGVRKKVVDWGSLN